MKRRDFLKQTSTDITAAAALTTLSSIQTVFANNLLRLEKQNNKGEYFANLRRQYLLNPAGYERAYLSAELLQCVSASLTLYPP